MGSRGPRAPVKRSSPRSPAGGCRTSSVRSATTGPAAGLRRGILHRVPSPRERTSERARVSVRPGGVRRRDHRELLALDAVRPLRGVRLSVPEGDRHAEGLPSPRLRDRGLPPDHSRSFGVRCPADPSAAFGSDEPPVRTTVDVAIVGGGESGRAVAVRLVEAGVRPAVFDRRLDPSPIPGVDFAPSTTVTFLPAPGKTTDPRFTLLGYQEPSRGVEVHARAVVVATGGYARRSSLRATTTPGSSRAMGRSHSSTATAGRRSRERCWSAATRERTSC